MNRIKALREKLNIKQVDFAREFNVSQGTLSNWERGVHEPDTESLKKMRGTFNRTSDYILGLSDDPTPPRSASDGSGKVVRTVRREDISVSFYGGGEDDLTDEDIEDILDIVESVSEQRKKRMAEKRKRSVKNDNT